MDKLTPKQGGLAYKDYPNPHGLRAYEKDDGSYGGQMIPKADGWLGPLKGKGKNKGHVMTEYSLEDEKGSFPSLVPTLTKKELELVLSGKGTEDTDRKAMEFRDMRLKLGLDPFYNPEGFDGKARLKEEDEFEKGFTKVRGK